MRTPKTSSRNISIAKWHVKKKLHPVDEYVRQVISGKIVTGKYVRLACERHIKDLKNKKYIFDYQLADHAINFYKYLSHSKGEWAGSELKLELWQMFTIGSIFGWIIKKTGLRRYKKAFIRVGRKNGKSTLLAGTGNYLLVGDGEPGAEVYTAATKLDQARIVHQESIRMVKKSKHLSKICKVFKNNISIEGTASKFEPLGRDSDSLDGLNPHGAIIDELHAHKFRDLWDVLISALGARRQPLMLAITTAGFNKNGICYEIDDKCKKILDGILEDDSYFAFIAELDKDDDYYDESNWIKANPNLGVSLSLDYLRDQARDAKNSPAALNNFLCKHMNLWVNQSERFIPMDKWKEIDQVVTLEDLKGLTVTVGLDLSTRQDLTAISFCGETDTGEYKFFTHFFMPEDNIDEKMRRDQINYRLWVQQGYITATPGNVVDYDFVRDYIIKANSIVKIKEIGFDSWNALQLATQLRNDGFNMIEVRQGYASMSEPTKALLYMLLSKKLIHGNNPVLTWCADNMIVVKDPSGNLKPDKENAVQKIDGVVAMIIALSRAIVVEETPVSVYETRGARIL